MRPAGYRQKPVTNVIKITRDAYIFDDIYKQKTRLNIIAHGGHPIDGKQPFIVLDGSAITPKQLHGYLEERLELRNTAVLELFLAARPIQNILLRQSLRI